jgi:hypothetical protein
VPYWHIGKVSSLHQWPEGQLRSICGNEVNLVSGHMQQQHQIHTVSCVTGQSVAHAAITHHMYACRLAAVPAA